MGFKKFIKEMPLFSHPEDLECPFSGHQGPPINASKGFGFDSLSEAFTGEYQKRMAKGYTMMNPTGIVPLICIHDMKVFMWNTDTDETYAPQTSEDIAFCNEYIQVMKSERSQDRNAEPFRGRFDEIDRLTIQETK